MHCSRKLFFGIALSVTLVASQSAIAGDRLFWMTSLADQDSIAIGKVLSKAENQLVFESKQVLLGNRVPNKITITDYTPEQIGSLNGGDFAVLSLGRINRNGRYKLSQTAFKVSSPEPSEAKIIAGPLSGGDRIAYNWFINTCGGETDFAFDYSGEVDVASVKRESGLYEIAQRSVDSPVGAWEVVAEPSECRPVRLSWWQSLVNWLGSMH